MWDCDRRVTVNNEASNESIICHAYGIVLVKADVDSLGMRCAVGY